MERRKVGLALGSGVARGLAHIGVLEVLEREGIPIDMVAGTSMGAIVGAAYANRKSARQIKGFALELGWKKMLPLADITVLRTGFIGGRRIKKRLKEIIGEVSFADLAKPFACVATDVMTGEEVVFRDGLVLDAVIASISLPVIFRATKWRGRYLVDGTLVTPVPVRVLKEMGADFVIAVNVLHHPGRTTSSQPEETTKTKEPNIFNVMIQTVDILASHLVESSLSGADVVIEPDMAGIGLAGFGKAEECIRRGGLAAQKSIPEIKRRLSL
ncbi:MAG: patatin-like phospholipase family protein [Dehalococcoidales bacterium]|nr:patatin-like phospholipase family protein [Dehalococcoidales bacterium]